MANWSKTYTCNPVNITRLGMEIEDDGLTPNYLGAKDDHSGGADNLAVWFDAEVTGGELTTLDATVVAHGGSEAPYRTCFCYDCGCTCGERALSTLTACPVCTGTDIQTAYHNDNLDATTDPTVNDDGTQGYCEGSKWINVTANTAFICVDNATGSAIWKQDTDALPKSGGTMTGNIAMDSTETVDGRDVSVDGAKLDGIETLADVTGSTPPQAHDNTQHTTNYEAEFAKNTAFNKDFGAGSGEACEGDDGRLVESDVRATLLNRYQIDLNCSGVSPIQTDFLTWDVGDRGIAVGTGGREFFVKKTGESAIKYVEMF